MGGKGKFFPLDNDVYRDGAIPRKYKEMMGLVASHIVKCVEMGITKEEFWDQ
ncbi:MAG: carboxymuconolactone decarboxylase family protein [Candidatus Caldipriscus sp.]